jgi:outer membrane protein OmpA-like peptidoglycan-associated protein
MYDEASRLRVSACGRTPESAPEDHLSPVPKAEENRNEENLMKRLSVKAALLAMAAFLIVVLSVSGGAQDTVKVKGIIVGRDGAAMNIKGEAASWVVLLNESTKVEAKKGMLGVRKDALEVTDLIPGLPVEVETMHNGTDLVAASISFKADDLKTARQIQAGLNPHGEQLAGVQADQAAMNEKFGKLHDYDTKGEVTVYFDVAKATISDDAKQQLKQLAENAVTMKGYIIQVAGYTDSSGNADYNQELSDKRAKAVVNYLQQECKVPLFRVLAPEGMGESNPANTDESQQGKKENRRVEVKVLVNKGMQS